ncbi:MAG: tetratricopeptide repeat protein [Gemmatimonadales bacterium]
MRRARHSRSSGREQAIDELFSTAGLEADLPARGVDCGFSLRPFADGAAGDGMVEPEPVAEGSATDQLYRRAREAAERNRRVEATQLYRQLLAQEPAHLAGRNNLALLFEAAGEPEAAIDELTAALKHHPDQVDVLVNRGAILGSLKRYPAAESDLRRATRLAPQHAEAHFNLGLVLWRKGLPEDAAALFRRTIELDPESSQAWYYLGDALNQAGAFAESERALQRATELDPASSRAFQLLGRVLDRLGRPNEAIEMYRRAREAGSR